ncbi:MAG TPA: DUF1127 domain-containing protein [Chthonomonadaceae bacterium]|nr:DUF1127 domain-containing protein [Chthonomonadaceae bacterium]
MSSRDIPLENAGSPPSTDNALRRARRHAPLDVRIWRPHEALARWMECWRKRVRDRRLLASLDDHALRDLGLQRADVENQSTRSFWRGR